MTTGLVEMITSKGGDADQILRGCGLAPSALTKPDGFIATAQMARLLEDAAQATADDCFGLHFGERYNPKNIGPVTYTALNSPTIGAAIENIERYLKVHNEAARWVTTIEGERAYVVHGLVGLENENLRQYREASMAIALNTLRMMAGSQWVPQEVHFSHGLPAQDSEHIRIFGGPVQFGCASTAFVIDREFLERQVPAADPRLYGILRRYLDVILAEMPPEDNFLGSIRKAIAEAMRNGDPKLARVAKATAMSPRTLQRRLQEYGVDFKKLADDTRRRFASDYLKNHQHTLTEVAFLLGYSDVSAFNRACKRWTGKTPLEYRRKALR